LVAENMTTETRQKRQRLGRSRWELLGKTEVPHIRQEESGLEPRLQVKGIQAMRQESHATSAAHPSAAGRAGRKLYRDFCNHGSLPWPRKCLCVLAKRLQRWMRPRLQSW